MPSLKPLTQLWQEANALAQADDLVGLIGLITYLIDHYGAYPSAEYELILDHLQGIALARRLRLARQQYMVPN